MIDKIPESENEILKVFDYPEYEIRNGHIEELFLRFNFDKLAILPKNIGILKYLRKFGLPENSLTILPESFEKLKKLRYLDLTGNKISLLENITNFTQLEKLYLGFNQITSIPANIENLKFLANLELQNNEITQNGKHSHY